MSAAQKKVIRRTRWQQKFTLTGMPTGPIVATANYFRFEMEEGGSPVPPKGLPVASVMTFTVWVSTKAGKTLGFPRKPAHRLLVQGELVADLPMSQCPGEIGVIAFKIEEILPKDAPVPDSVPTVPTPPIRRESPRSAPPGRHKAPPSAPSVGSRPDLSAYPVLPLEQIAIPDEFQRTPPSAQRTAELQTQITEQGQLDDPFGGAADRRVARVSAEGWLSPVSDRQAVRVGHRAGADCHRAMTSGGEKR